LHIAWATEREDTNAVFLLELVNKHLLLHFAAVKAYVVAGFARLALPAEPVCHMLSASRTLQLIFQHECLALFIRNSVEMFDRRQALRPHSAAFISFLLKKIDSGVGTDTRRIALRVFLYRILRWGPHCVRLLRSRVDYELLDHRLIALELLMVRMAILLAKSDTHDHFDELGE